MADIDDIHDRVQWLAQGREIERGAVVAWLRRSRKARDVTTLVEIEVCEHIAAAIERVEHLKETP